MGMVDQSSYVGLYIGLRRLADSSEERQQIVPLQQGRQQKCGIVRSVFSDQRFLGLRPGSPTKSVGEHLAVREDSTIAVSLPNRPPRNGTPMEGRKKTAFTKDKMTSDYGPFEHGLARIVDVDYEERSLAIRLEFQMMFNIEGDKEEIQKVEYGWTKNDNSKRYLSATISDFQLNFPLIRDENQGSLIATFGPGFSATRNHSPGQFGDPFKLPEDGLSSLPFENIWPSSIPYFTEEVPPAAVGGLIADVSKRNLLNVRSQVVLNVACVDCSLDCKGYRGVEERRSYY